MRNQLRIITINDIWILGGKLETFTKIMGKIHGSRKKKRGQSRITGKIKDSNSRFTKKIKLNSRITEKISGGQFTVHEENKTQFTVHSKNKSPITVHGNTSLRPSLKLFAIWDLSVTFMPFIETEVAILVLFFCLPMASFNIDHIFIVA